jgi:hypothetical protein
MEGQIGVLKQFNCGFSARLRVPYQTTNYMCHHDSYLLAMDMDEYVLKWQAPRSWQWKGFCSKKDRAYHKKLLRSAFAMEGFAVE